MELASIIVAVISVLIAIAALGWTVYRDRRQTAALATESDERKAADAREEQRRDEELELVRREQARRPRLSLHDDPDKIYTHVEAGALHVRLLVANDPGLRASRGTQVLLDRIFTPGLEQPATIGSP